MRAWKVGLCLPQGGSSEWIGHANKVVSVAKGSAGVQGSKLQLPDLGNKNAGYPVKVEFQANKE